jgi:hypothetical protein
VVTPEHVCIVINVSSAHIVPRQAFDSPAQAELFAHTAAEYHRNAQTSPGPPFAPGAPPLDSNSMQVTYRNTAAEFLSVYFGGLQNDPARKVFTARSYSGFIAGTVLFMWIAGRGDFWLQMLFGWATLLPPALVTLTWTPRLMRRLVRSGAEKRRYEDQTVTISVEGIAMVDADSEGFLAWQELSSVEEDDRFIVFYRNARSDIACLIPKQAFASADLANQFASLAKRHWQRLQPAASPELVLAELVETGNPYQSPTTR